MEDTMHKASSSPPLGSQTFEAGQPTISSPPHLLPTSHPSPDAKALSRSATNPNPSTSSSSGGIASSPPPLSSTSSLPNSSPINVPGARPSSSSVGEASSPSRIASSPSSSTLLSTLNIPHTLSSLHSRYTLRRQASQTFKEMRKRDDEVDQQGSYPHNPPSRSASFDDCITPIATQTHSSSSGPMTPPKMQGMADPTQAAPAISTSVFDIPASLQKGESMLKVTHKKVMQRVFKVDADRGQIVWASKKGNRINLESIREVRIGASGASFRTSLNISVSHEPRWISIIYQQLGAYKALHLIALSEESLERWRQTLERLRGLRQQLLGGLVGLEQRNDLWLRQHWRGADSSQDEKLSFKEVVRLCTRIGMQASPKELLQRFKQADRKDRGFLDFADFQFFVTLLKRRQEVEELFASWADVTLDLTNTDPTARTGHPSSSAISFERFRQFLEQEQASTPPGDTSDESATLLFSKYSSRRHGGLLYDGFIAYLQSDDNAALKDSTPIIVRDASCDKPDRIRTNQQEPRLLRSTAETAEELLAAESTTSDACQHAIAPQPMDKPLSDYFISSSHNTYLIGGQWRGDSTVEGYIRALQNGARSVELDCWDGPNGQPQITHGHTLTSKVPFRDVIAAIARYAFVKSKYPLILSLEVHNDLPQQATMARILRELLGDALLSEKLTSQLKPSELPTPEELRGKILVKAKNIQVSQDSIVQVPDDDDDVGSDAVLGLRLVPSHSSATETESESDNGIFASAKGLVRSVRRRRHRDSGNSSSGSTGGRRSSTSSSSSSRRGSQKFEKASIAPELASLLIYTIGVKHRGINKKEVYASEHMISLSERTAFKYVRDRNLREDLIKHNRTHLTRTYPSMGSIARLHASANYLPHHLWALGCQLVSLNWQTLDMGYALNQMMFARNAGCGYVLKPPGLRVKELLKSTSARLRCVLEVTVISAQQLPRLRDVNQDKEILLKDDDDDDHEAVDPFIAISLLAPESWGKQPQVLQDQLPAVASKNGSSIVDQVPVDPLSLKSVSTLAVDKGLQTGGTPKAAEKEDPSIRSPGQSVDAKLPSRPPLRPSPSSGMGPRSSTFATHIVKGNGFNPIWNCPLRIGIDVPAGEAAAATLSKDDDAPSPDLPESLTRGLLDLAFVRFEVCEDVNRSQAPTPPSVSLSLSPSSSHSSPSPAVSSSSTISSSSVLASYTTSVGGLASGYRHLPLYDAQLQQYPFSTLFIKSRLRVLGLAD